jgi:AraC-like DNA-binding protein
VTYQGTGQPMDDVVLSFGEPDHVFARQHDRETSIRRGDAFLLRCGARTQVRVPEGGQFMCLRLPRSSIQTSVADLDSAYCRPIPRDTPSLRLLKRYLGVFDVTDEALAAPAVQHSAVTHIYDLLALVLGATRDAAHIAEARGMRAARLKAIKDDIARHLREESLSVGAVAARHKVTPRYVQRLFEESGVTFTEYVIAQRLARAHRLVCDPQLSERTLTAIARDVGFGDRSYFNRAFRRRYGVTPSDLRAQARNQ